MERHLTLRRLRPGRGERWKPKTSRNRKMSEEVFFSARLRRRSPLSMFGEIRPDMGGGGQKTVPPPKSETCSTHPADNRRRRLRLINWWIIRQKSVLSAPTLRLQSHLRIEVPLIVKRSQQMRVLLYGKRAKKNAQSFTPQKGCRSFYGANYASRAKNMRK